MFTYCFNNGLIFISLHYIFMITNTAKLISRSGTIQFYCIVLYCLQIGMVGWYSASLTTLSGCYSKELAFATADNKVAINAHVDDIKAGGATNYIDPLQKAFELLASSQTVADNRRKYRMPEHCSLSQNGCSRRGYNQCGIW